MPNWNIHAVLEKGETDVLLSDVLIDGQFHFYPEVLHSNFFNFSFKGSKLVLVAGNHVGLVPLNDRVALLIEPKVGRDNWIHIVGKARGYLRELQFIVDYSRTETTSTSLLEFLGRAFLAQLRSIDKQGIFRQYVPQNEITTSPRGRILFKESMRTVWSKGNRTSVAVRHYAFSADTPHNRLIKYALALAIDYLSRIPTTKSEMRRFMTDLENLFSSVPFDPTLNYLPRVLASLENRNIPEARTYYEEICRTAILLVEQAGLSPKRQAADQTLTFVVNMEVVFQNYCYQVLKEQSAIFPKGTSIELEPDGRIPLFTGPNCEVRSAEPDILLTDANGIRLPIEVKYKDTPSRADMNQAITYASAYRSNNVVLLCYAPDEHRAGWQYIGKVGEQINVWIYRIRLASKNIESEEHGFVEQVNEMLRGQINPI